MPVLSKTRADLVARALELNGLVAPYEAENADATDSKVDTLFATLSARNIYTVGDDEEIDLQAFEPLAAVLADLVAPRFGRARDPVTVGLAERTLIQIGVSQPTYEPLVVNYF